MTYFERYHIDITPPADAWDANVAPDEWKRDVESQLRKIESTDAGKALLNNLTKSTSASNPIAWILIRQINPIGKSYCNAASQVRRTFTNANLRWHLGEIIYEPNQFHQKGNYCYEKMGRGDPKKNRGKRPDEVLFHELVHAHRIALRLFDDIQTKGSLHKYDNYEDFIAIVLTNIYISDITNLGSSGLRGSHRSGEPLERELADSIAFYAAREQVYPIISKFADEEWPLFNALADVEASFNPLRAFQKNKTAVMAASQSSLAKQRDTTGEKAEQERQLRKQILSYFGVSSAARQPEPRLKDIARVVLSPLAKQAIAVLKK